MTKTSSLRGFQHHGKTDFSPHTRVYRPNILYCNNGCAISFGTTRGALVPNFPARFQRHRKTGANWLLMDLESVRLRVKSLYTHVGVYTLYYIILCTRFTLTTARRVNRDKFRGDGYEFASRTRNEWAILQSLWRCCG